jgi:hypothetical protein
MQFFFQFQSQLSAYRDSIHSVALSHHQKRFVNAPAPNELSGGSLKERFPMSKAGCREWQPRQPG